MDFKRDLIGIAIGIRFKRSFRVGGITGDIVDEILTSEKSPFNSEFFPVIQEGVRGEKLLQNPTTNESLLINSDDIILQIKINGDFTSKFKWVREKIIPYFVNDLFYKFKIKNVQRIGFLFYHELSSLDRKFFKNIIDEFSKSKVKNAEDVNIAFSKKMPSIKGLISKNIHNYKRMIYSFNIVPDKVYANFDYQYYFVPTIEDLRDGDLGEISKDAPEFLEKEFYSWLKKYGKE